MRRWRLAARSGEPAWSDPLLSLAPSSKPPRGPAMTAPAEAPVAALAGRSAGRAAGCCGALLAPPGLRGSAAASLVCCINCCPIVWSGTGHTLNELCRPRLRPVAVGCALGIPSVAIACSGAPAAGSCAPAAGSCGTPKLASSAPCLRGWPAGEGAACPGSPCTRLFPLSAATAAGAECPCGCGLGAGAAAAPMPASPPLATAGAEPAGPDSCG